MRDVIVPQLPSCDVNPLEKARYNTPTKLDSVGAGRWANLCKQHMKSMGVMTSVTERFRLKPRNERKGK